MNRNGALNLKNGMHPEERMARLWDTLRIASLDPPRQI
jgi:hypothetical protein